GAALLVDLRLLRGGLLLLCRLLLPFEPPLLLLRYRLLLGLLLSLSRGLLLPLLLLRRGGLLLCGLLLSFKAALLLGRHALRRLLLLCPCLRLLLNLSRLLALLFQLTQLLHSRAVALLLPRFQLGDALVALLSESLLRLLPAADRHTIGALLSDHLPIVFNPQLVALLLFRHRLNLPGFGDIRLHGRHDRRDARHDRAIKRRCRLHLAPRLFALPLLLLHRDVADAFDLISVNHRLR